MNSKDAGEMVPAIALNQIVSLSHEKKGRTILVLAEDDAKNRLILEISTAILSASLPLLLREIALANNEAGTSTAKPYAIAAGATVKAYEDLHAVMVKFEFENKSDFEIEIDRKGAIKVAQAIITSLTA